MKYSLVKVIHERDGIVAGYWLRNVVGDMADAVQRAEGLVHANGGAIRVAVVEEIPSTTPWASLHHNLRLLGPIVSLSGVAL